MRKSLESKIRFNLVLICIVAVVICGGMIFYIYSLNKTIAGQKENIKKSNQILSLTDSLVVTVQEAQLASNTYLFTNNRKYLKQFQQSSILIEEQIDSLLLLSNEASQMEKLKEMGALLKQKEKVVARLTRSLNRNAPFDTIKVQLQEIEPEMMEDTVKVTVTRQDTVVIKKKSAFQKFFSKNKEPEIMNVSSVTMVDTFVNTAEEKQNVISQVIELSEEASQRYARRMQRIGQQVNELIIADQEISMQFLDILLKLHRESLNTTLAEIQKNESLIRKNYVFSIIVGILSLGLILLFIILIINDVNKGHKARIALAEEKKKTEDLMRSRHELLLSVSHDIKAPLSSMLGYLDLFENETHLSEKERSAIHSMQSSGAHILSLLTNLLEFSRLEQGRVEVKNTILNVQEMCEDIAVMFRPLAIQKKLEFEYINYAENVQYIFSDELKIRQILVNILSNAVKYTSEGKVEFIIKEEDTKLIFEIIDSGVGIPKGKMGNLFKPFSRLDENASLAEGSGFGLYVVKGLVDILNGNISIDSQMKKGTCIKVELPVKKIDKADVQNKESIKLPLSGNKYSILIIDDDYVFLSMLNEKLSRLGHGVFICQNISDFEGQLDRLVDYDMVLTDMEMGNISGKSILNKVRSVNETIPVFLMTARSEVETWKYEGFDGCLQKPFSTDYLIALYEGEIPEGNIDYSFSSLVEMFGGDEEAIKAILNTFVDSTDTNLETLIQAVKEDDFYWTQSLCHKMLPMYAQLSLGNLVEMLRKIDNLIGKSPKEFPEWKTEMQIFIEDSKIMIANIRRKYTL